MLAIVHLTVGLPRKKIGEGIEIKKNVVFSSTRQWNVGDEFILRGCIRLLSELFGEFNPIIYNRHPDVRPRLNHLNPLRSKWAANLEFWGRPLLESFLRIGFWDDSFKGDHDNRYLDLAVFAGTPEWYGPRLKTLYETIATHDLPVCFLGIGSSYPFRLRDISKTYRRVLEKARLIIVRDRLTEEGLKSLRPHRLPCPALFAALAEEERQVSGVTKIGLVFATNLAVVNNRVTEDTFRFMIALFSRLMEKYDCELVCHYIDELPEVRKTFPGMTFHYSFDSSDYRDIYRRFDFVVGARLHGIGLAASLGIPGVLIGHDVRSETGTGFLAEIVSPAQGVNDALRMIGKHLNDVANLSRSLLEHKRTAKERYLELLSDL